MGVSLWESTWHPRQREKRKGARGQGGGGDPQRWERRELLSVAKDHSLGAGRPREAGPPRGLRRQSWAPGSCYPTRDKDKRGCEERMNEEESLWGEWGFFIGQRPQGFPGATWRIQDD